MDGTALYMDSSIQTRRLSVSTGLCLRQRQWSTHLVREQAELVPFRPWRALTWLQRCSLPPVCSWQATWQASAVGNCRTRLPAQQCNDSECMFFVVAQTSNC